MEKHYLHSELLEYISNDSSILEYIQEYLVDGLWCWDYEQPEVEWFSSSFWKLLGYDPKEMPHLSSSWQKLIHSDDLNRAISNLDIHLKNPQIPFNNIVRYTHKDGHDVWVRCRGFAIRNEKGEPIRVLGIHQDITSLKETEHRLKLEKERSSLNEKKYRSIFENAPLAFQSLNMAGEIVDVNPRWLATLEYEKEEVVGKWFGSFVAPHFVEQFKKCFSQLKRDGYIDGVEFDMVTKSGRDISIELQSKVEVDATGLPLLTYCAFKDVTSEKKAAKEARERDDLFRILFEQSPTGITRVNEKGEFLQVNQKFSNFLGFTTEELLSRSIADVTLQEDKNIFSDQMDKVEADQKSEFTTEKRYKHKSGKIVWGAVSTNIVRTDDGRVKYIIGNIIDITKQKEAEIKLRNSEEEYRILAESTLEKLNSHASVSNTTTLFFDIDLILMSHNNYSNTTSAILQLEITDSIDVLYSFVKDVDLRKCCQKVISDLRSFEMEVETFTGIRYWMRIAPYIEEKKVTQGVVISFTEIFTNKRIKESKQGHFDISAFRAYAIINEHSKIIHVNDAFIDMWGYDYHEEFIGRSYVDICYDHREVQKMFDIVEEEGTQNIDFKGLRKDQSVFDVSMNVSFFRDEIGNEFYAVFARDITCQARQSKHQNNLETLVYKKIKEIAESEYKFRSIFEHSIIGIAISTPEGVQLDANNKILQMLGYSRDEFIGLRIGKLSHPDDRIGELNLVEELYSGKRDHYRIQKRIKTKSGAYKWFDVSITTRRNDEGKVELGTAMIIDIDEQKRNTSLINAFFEQPQNIHLISNNVGDIHRLNIGWTNVLGYDIESCIGRSTLEFMHPDDVEKSVIEIKSIASGKKTMNFENRYKHKDGHYVTLEWSAVSTAFGEKLLAIATDITQRKKAEDMQKRQNAFTQKILDYFPIGIATNDMDSLKVKYTNKMFEEIYGWPKEDYKGALDFYQCIMPDKQYREKVQSQVLADIASEDISRMTWENIAITTKKGEERVVIAANIPLPEHDTMVSTVRDVTKQYRHEQQIVEQNNQLKQINEQLKIAKESAEESDKLKSEFLHNMSHEIRTPMNGIIGFSKLLCKEETTKDQTNYYATIVQNSSKQLLRIIDDILEISRLETKQLVVYEEEFNLNDLLMEIFSIYDLKSKERKIPLYIKKSLLNEYSVVICDKTKLTKIIDNLLDNALKFTNNGFIELGYIVDSTILQIYVKDTGIGISEDKKERIFERFSQEDNNIAYSHGGLGLGLSISKENAQLLGGDITMESEKGKGSTFTITIPYKPVRRECAYSSIEKNNFCILIAEDEEINYIYLETIISNIKNVRAKILHAKNGKEAVEICKNNSDIDLVLMDVKMPLLNGYEATAEIRKTNKHLPIIAQTAYSTAKEKANCLKYGCDRFISKPIDEEEIIELILETLKVER